MTAEEFETLLDPDISQESSLRTFCINSRSKKRKYTEVFETDQTQDINQTTILDQIGNISRQYSEVYNDDIPRSSSQTKHSKSCDTLQDFSHIEDQTLHDVSLFNCSANELNTIDDQTFIYNEETNPTVLENTEHFDLNATPPSLSVKEMMLPKLNQLQLKRKQKQRKFRFVDKLLKMPITKNMSISFDQYQKLHMEDLPRVNFDQMVYKHKFGVDVLFQTASRPNISPRLLMQFKRHLKKIPQTVIDKKSPRNNVAQESTPISKKPTTKMNPAVVKCSGEKNNNTILGMELPDVDSEMLKSARMSLWMNDEIDIAEPVAMMKPKTRNTVVHEYDEK